MKKSLAVFVLLTLLSLVFIYAQHSNRSYLSLKEIKSKLEAKRYSFSEPYSEQGLTRIASFDKARGRSMYLYYKKDPINQVKFNIVIKESRHKLEEHFDTFLPIIEIISPVGKKWVQDQLTQHTAGQKLEKTTTINKQFYILNYYPDFNQDLLNIGLFDRTPF